MMELEKLPRCWAGRELEKDAGSFLWDYQLGRFRRCYMEKAEIIMDRRV